MKRPCLDCGVLAETHRCPQHLAIWQTAQEQYRTRRRASTAERGYDAAWRKVSRAVILASPVCERCGSTQDLTCDHRVALANGGERLAVSNLRVLCRSCNSRKGAR